MFIGVLAFLALCLREVESPERVRLRTKRLPKNAEIVQGCAEHR
jgi:hypothetical protein